jgi:hypothetical protein
MVYVVIATEITPAASTTPAFLEKTPPNLNVMSDMTFLTARFLINHCLKTHDQCNRRVKQSVYKLPRRLIGVAKSTASTPMVKLVKKTRSCKYAALSYCWGQDQLKTTKASVSRFHSGITLTDLSKTVQDAVRVVQRLGIRYLWVDCLCIIQDDDNNVAAEIGKMADVYQGALVNIVASCASNSDQGFLGRRPDILTSSFVLRTFTGDVAKLVLEPSGAYGLAEESVNKQAWFMQESLLSPRLLMFGSCQLL